MASVGRASSRHVKVTPSVRGRNALAPKPYVDLLQYLPISGGVAVINGGNTAPVDLLTEIKRQIDANNKVSLYYYTYDSLNYQLIRCDYQCRRLKRGQLSMSFVNAVATTNLRRIKKSSNLSAPNGAIYEFTYKNVSDFYESVPENAIILYGHVYMPQPKMSTLFNLVRVARSDEQAIDTISLDVLRSLAVQSGVPTPPTTLDKKSWMSAIVNHLATRLHVSTASLRAASLRSNIIWVLNDLPIDRNVFKKGAGDTQSTDIMQKYNRTHDIFNRITNLLKTHKIKVSPANIIK